MANRVHLVVPGLVGRNGRDHRRCVGLAGRHLKRAGLLYSDHMDVQDGEAIFRHACRNGPRRHHLEAG
jgi:hypothetical protein